MKPIRQLLLACGICIDILYCRGHFLASLKTFFPRPLGCPVTLPHFWPLHRQT
jgi:hypothetical protein